MTRRVLAILVVALAIVGSAIAAPKQRPHRKHGARPTAGSGSAVGSAGSGAALTGSGGSAAPGSAGSAAPVPAIEPAAPISTGSASGSGVVIAPVPATVAAPASPPPPASLAMRDTTHGGAIAEMDCKACHTSAGWKLGAGAGASGFDHDRTGFPLHGAHAQTTCGGCHIGATPLQTTCAGCHRDPHQGRQGKACEECHTAVAWSDTNTLEQHRRTRMPLTGRHATVECAACHKRQSERTWSDAPVDCYACHRTDYHRADVHPTHDGTTGSPAFSRDCGSCHQTSGWSPATIDTFDVAALAGAHRARRRVPTVDRQPRERGVHELSCRCAAPEARALRRLSSGRAATYAASWCDRRARRAVVSALSSARRRAMRAGLAIVFAIALPARAWADRISVKVVEVAGGVAYVEPGASAGLGPGRS